MKNTILSEQTYATPPADDNDTETSIHCDNCKKPIEEWGIIHIIKLETTKQITFLCSIACKKRFKSNKFCPHCGGEFDTYKIHRPNQKFCSRKCQREAGKIKCGLCVRCGKQIEGFERNKSQKKQYCSKECKTTGSYKYNTHYFCDNCHKWIPIKDAVKRNDVKRDNYLVCPKLGCNGNKLRTRSRLAMLNQRRNNVKRIE